MRPKFVLAVLLSASLLLGAALYLKTRLGNTDTLPAGPEITAAPPAELAEPNVAPSIAPLPAPAEVANVLTPEQRQAAIGAEIERLQQLSLTGDPASLSDILAGLASPEPEIREAATEAAREFGSTNAIPALKAAAENTEDIQEKIAFLEAAEFLSLPPLTFDGRPAVRTPEQILADQQRREQRQARRQARMQRNAPHRDAASPPPATNP